MESTEGRDPPHAAAAAAAAHAHHPGARTLTALAVEPMQAWFPMRHPAASPQQGTVGTIGVVQLRKPAAVAVAAPALVLPLPPPLLRDMHRTPSQRPLHLSTNLDSQGSAVFQSWITHSSAGERGLRGAATAAAQRAQRAVPELPPTFANAPCRKATEPPSNKLQHARGQPRGRSACLERRPGCLGPVAVEAPRHPQAGRLGNALYSPARLLRSLPPFPRYTLVVERLEQSCCKASAAPR